MKNIIINGNKAKEILIHFRDIALKPLSKAKTTRVTPKKIRTSYIDNPNASPLNPKINEFTITVARMNHGILYQNFHMANAKPIINTSGTNSNCAVKKEAVS